MIAILIYCLVTFGANWGAGHAELSYPARLLISGRDRPKSFLRPLRAWLLKLLECPGCLGFWLGVVAVATELAPMEFPHSVGGAVACGLFTSASNLLLAKYVGLLDT